MKKKIVVYGLGQFYLDNKNILFEEYAVEALVDKRKAGTQVDDMQVLGIDDIAKIDCDYIVIMLKDFNLIYTVVNELIKEYQIPSSKLLLGINQINKRIDDVKIDIVGKSRGEIHFLVKLKGIECEVSTIDEYNNVMEVVCGGNYNYSMANEKKDIVIDVGMNVGSACLYFLSRQNVEKVYGFEPFKETFDTAASNLRKYLAESDRVELFNWGLSDTDEKRCVGYNSDMTCGLSTIVGNISRIEERYKEWGIGDEDNTKQTEVEVRKASRVIKNIINKNKNKNIILKMDCEGEEYCIFEDLDREGVLKSIDLIMLEWHYQGSNKLTSILANNHFSFWDFSKMNGLGLIYAINCAIE